MQVIGQVGIVRRDKFTSLEALKKCEKNKYCDLNHYCIVEVMFFEHFENIKEKKKENTFLQIQKYKNHAVMKIHPMLLMILII